MTEEEEKRPELEGEKGKQGKGGVLRRRAVDGDKRRKSCLFSNQYFTKRMSFPQGYSKGIMNQSCNLSNIC